MKTSAMSAPDPAEPPEHAHAEPARWLPAHCPQCGAVNPFFSAACGTCGRLLTLKSAPLTSRVELLGALLVVTAVLIDAVSLLLMLR